MSTQSSSSSSYDLADVVLLHPFKAVDPVQLIFSKIIIGPCGVLIVTSSILLFYLIIKHFTSLIHLYFSLLLYTSCQIFLVLVLFMSPLVQERSSTTDMCPAISVIELLAPILPCYGVVIVTAAKWVCVAYPLQFRRILSLKIQIVVVSLVVALLTILACLPFFGICNYTWKPSQKMESGGYCSIGTDAPEQCLVFKWMVVVVGYISPCLGVLIFYCLIVKVLIAHKRRGNNLGKVQGKTATSKVDYNYKPVTTTEKLAHLRAIGQDAVPWSLVVIAVLATMTSLMWIPQIFVQDLYYDSTLATFLVLDLANCLMFVATSVSPLAYILFTPLMRQKLCKMCKSKLNTSVKWNQQV